MIVIIISTATQFLFCAPGESMTKRKTILISDNSNALLKHHTIILKKMGFYVVPVRKDLRFSRKSHLFCPI